MNFINMQKEILDNNEADVFRKYLEIFRTQINLPQKNVCFGEQWLRGRTHCDTFKVSFDDYDTDIEVPYFKKEIGAPPTERTKSYRFNRTNIAYLYLTSDLNTCMAEIRLKENEICSISNFVCVRESTYVDVISMLNIVELKQLADILLQPVDDNEKIYEVTQFISDIFREMGYAGILYPSTIINKGINLVCFYPEYFQFIMYSDRIYKGVADCVGNILPVSQIDEFKKYPEYRKEMYSFGDTPEKEEAFEYIENKIIFEDEQEYDDRVRMILNLKNAEIDNALNEFVEYFSKTHLRKRAYQFRGTYRINAGNIKAGIRDYILSLNVCNAQRTTLYDSVVHAIFDSKDIDITFKIEALKQKIYEECNLYIQESDKKWDEMMEKLRILNYR
ncbi:RES domain-containing protein [bacterium D16-51]|nr:RES domain-containing protein [bacterium D16-59]RKI57409.1 RES domain-containing protein [bacterium D16-51]